MRSAQWDSSWPSFANPDERDLCLDYWEARFGIPKHHFSQYHILVTSRTFYLLNKSNHLEAISSLKIQQAGIPFIRRVGRFLKPTTCAAQLFGRHATRYIFDISWPQLKVLADTGSLPLEPSDKSSGLDGVFPVPLDQQWETGYIFLRLGDGVIGVSLLVMEEKKVLCRLPKSIKRAISRR